MRRRLDAQKVEPDKLKKHLVRFLAGFPVMVAIIMLFYWLFISGLAFLVFEPTTSNKEVVTSLLQVEASLMGLLTIGVFIYQGSERWRKLSEYRLFPFHFAVSCFIAFFVFMVIAVFSTLITLSFLSSSPYQIATMMFRYSIIFLVFGVIFFIIALCLTASLSLEDQKDRMK